MEIHCSL